MAKIGIIRIKKLVDALLDFVKTDYVSKTISLVITVIDTTPNSVGVKQKETLIITGSLGRSLVTQAGELSKLISFNGTANQTAIDFVNVNAPSYLEKGIVLTYSTNNIIMEALVAGVPFARPVITSLISESFLLRCFDDDDYSEEISYKDLAVEIFTRTDQESRKIETRLMFDIDRASLPTVHVREPAKSKGVQDGIGYIDEEIFVNSDDSFNETRRRSFSSQYELMITSANRHEVIIMEEILLALLIGAQDSLAVQDPFYTISFSVKELIANNELVQTPLFIKSIALNVGYDKSYPDISNNELLTKILFEQNLLT